jgi:hypothetical protein
LMARVVGLPGSVSGFAQRHFVCAHPCCGARRVPPRWPEP